MFQCFRCGEPLEQQLLECPLPLIVLLTMDSPLVLFSIS